MLSCVGMCWDVVEGLRTCVERAWSAWSATGRAAGRLTDHNSNRSDVARLLKIIQTAESF
jgi:hypothetical protein